MDVMSAKRTSFVAFFLPVFAAVSSSCAGGTGGKRFDFDARIGGIASADPSAFTFTNQNDWVITLTRAEVTLGPIYLNVVTPLVDRPLGLLDRLVPSAWARGEAHLDPGRIVGEVLAQASFNALSAELVSFPLRGALTEEQVHTAEVWFYPQAGVSADVKKIDTPALEVAGTATRGDSTVAFRGTLILNDAWLTDQPSGQQGSQPITEIRKLRGIPASFFPTQGGSLELRFDVTRLFRGANFSNLTQNPSDPDGTKLLVQSKAGPVTTDQVMTNLYQGLRDASTYSAEWVKP